MAFVHGVNALLTVNSVVLGTFINDLSFERTVDTAETTTFGATGNAKTYIPGLSDATLSCSGLYDKTATTGIIFALEAILAGGAAVAAVIKPAGSASGNYSYACNVILTSFPITSSIGDAVQVSADFQVTGPVTPSTP